MARTEFMGVQKHLGSPHVVVFDQESKGLRNKTSIFIPRKVFDKKETPKKLRVTVEWVEKE